MQHKILEEERTPESTCRATSQASPRVAPPVRLCGMSIHSNNLDIYNGCNSGSNRELRAPSPAVFQEPMRLRAGGPIIGDVEGVAVDELPDRAALQSQRESFGRSPRNSVWRKQPKPWGRMPSDPNSVFSSRFPTVRIMSGAAAFNHLVNRRPRAAERLSPIGPPNQLKQ